MPANYPNPVYSTWVDGADVYAASAVNLIQDVNLQIIADMQRGWLQSRVTWTYVTAATFTVPGDYTLVFHKGTKLRWFQTTTRYGYVYSSSFGAGVTTVTIVTNTDYVIANAAITLACYSYEDHPQEFPDWFNYTPTFTGFSADPTTLVTRFKIQGHTCVVVMRQGADGTSNATTFTVTAPVTAATVTSAFWCAPCSYRDNGAAPTTWGKIQIGSAATAFSVYTDASAGVWTNANGKRITNMNAIFYEI